MKALNLTWEEFSVEGAKAFKATSGKYTMKAIYTNNAVTYEAYGIKFGQYKTLIFVLEEDGEPIHFSVGGWNK